jgi:hypothetical protein
MILFSTTFYLTGVLGRAHDAGRHSYTIYSYLQLIKFCARESLVVEACAWCKGEKRRILYKEKMRSYPLRKDCFPTGFSQWVTSPFFLGMMRIILFFGHVLS